LHASQYRHVRAWFIGVDDRQMSVTSRNLRRVWRERISRASAGGQM